MPSILKLTLCFALWLAISAQAEDLSSVSISGQYKISGNGAATYQIALKIPPGAAGVAPSLSLDYNSQRGNGILGVGMSLGGISSINRCAKTVAQDGVNGSVNYNNNDRLCLDGRRLMVVSGTYGGDGAEYRFEVDDFSRIVEKGDMSSNTSWFEVTSRDGTIKQYGASASSRIEAQGTSTISVWALYRQINTSQNYIEWNYAKYSDTGEWYPSNIYYAGRLADSAGSAIAPFAEVKFLTYGESDSGESRPDSIPLYKAGSKFQLTKRIRKIQTYVEGALVKEYRLTYDVSPNSKNSRITQIAECAPSGTCLLPTTLTWVSSGSTSYGFEKFAGVSTYFDSAESPYNAFGFGGTGRAAMLAVNPGNAAFNIFSIDSGSSLSTIVARNDSDTNRVQDWDTKYRYFLADFNGDGLSDLLVRGGRTPIDNNARLYLSTGASVTPIDFNFEFGFDKVDDLDYYNTDNWRFFVADVNADGRSDVIHRDDGGTFTIFLANSLGVLEKNTTYLSNFQMTFGSIFADYTVYEQGLENASDATTQFLIEDVNGDGFPDLVLLYEGRFYVALGNGISFNEVVTFGSYYNGTPATTKALRADVNGDGLDDIVLFHGEGGPSVFLSTGTSFSDVGQVSGLCNYGPPTGEAGNGIEVVDINRDGRDDIVVYPADADARYSQGGSDRNLAVWLSTGTGFTQVAVLTNADTNGGYVRRVTLADFDGDGSTEFLLREAEALQGYRVTNTWPDVVRLIQDGTGQSLVFDYDYLSYVGSNIYTKDPVQAYPIMSLQTSKLVVKAVTMTNTTPASCFTIGPLSQCQSVAARSDVNPATTTYNYRYGGLRSELGTGRGLLGFRWIEQTFQQKNLVTKTEYEQSFPLTGMTKTMVQTVPGTSLGNGGTLSSQFNTNSVIALPNGRYFTFTSQSSLNKWDLNGAQWPSQTVTNTYDCQSNTTCYGNLASSVKNYSDGYSETRNFTYRVDTAKNILSMPTRIDVTKTSP